MKRRLLRLTGMVALAASFAGSVVVPMPLADELTPAASTPASAPAAATTGAAPAAATTGVAVPAPEQAPRVKYADLTNLQFTATTGLRASLSAPADGGFVSTLASKVTVATIAGAGVELAVNGVIVPSTHLGAQNVDESHDSTTFDYFGVAFAPGPNDVTLTPLGAEGLRGTPVHAVVYGAGPAVRVSARLIGELHADGKTSGLLRVAAFDRWEHPAMTGSKLQVTVVRGDVRIAPPIDLRAIAGKRDAAPAPSASPGTASGLPGGGGQQLDVILGDGGSADLIVVPGLTAGDVNVHLQTPTGAADDATFFVRPFVRAPLVNGLIDVGAGAVPGDHDGDGLADGGGARRHRVAVYGTGGVGKSTALSFAYETANRLSQNSSLGSFVGNAQDRPYQTYGDNSGHRIDALSDARLFARVENGHDALSYGAFRARVGDENSVGQFSQLMSGLNLEGAAAHGRVHFGGFTAKNAVAYARQTFAPSGLGALGQTLHGDIVVGSDDVELVSLDRRTGAVIAHTTLIREVDYTLDYVSGALRFIAVPLPFDASFNPQVVSVRYEYTGVARSAATSGGRISAAFGRAGGGPTLAVGYVNDASGNGAYSLLQKDLSGRFRGGAWSLSHASAAGLVPGGDLVTGVVSGGAFRGALTMAGPSGRLALSYADASAGFTNPFGGLTAPGLRDLHLDASRSTRQGELGITVQSDRNHGFGADSSLSSVALRSRRRVGKMIFRAELDAQRQSGTTVASVYAPTLPGLATVPAPVVVPTAAPNGMPQGGEQLLLGVETQIANGVALALTHSTPLGGTATSALPAQTSADLTVALGKQGRLYARELWSNAAAVPFAASTSALTSNAGARRQTTIGFDRTVGKNTSVASEYSLQNVGDAQTVFSSIGVRERFTVGKRFSGDALYQTGNSSAGGSVALATQAAPSGFSLYGTTFSYAGNGARITGSFQDRTGAYGGISGTLGFAAALSPSLSVLGNWNGTNQGGYRAEELKVGGAWRPVDNDRGAALFELERRSGSTLGPVGGAISDVASYEQVYRPGRNLELSGRVAYKVDGDGFYAAHTVLYDARVDQRVGRRLDVALETRTLAVPGINRATQTALGAEAGYRLGSAMRLAAGYHFSAAADPTLSTTAPRKGAYVTFTSVVDRIFGWGARTK